LVTPRGGLHGGPVGQHMSYQMRLFAAGEFDGTAARWAC
jgi:hypothetical protein